MKPNMGSGPDATAERELTLRVTAQDGASRISLAVWLLYKVLVPNTTPSSTAAQLTTRESATGNAHLDGHNWLSQPPEGKWLCINQRAA